MRPAPACRLALVLAAGLLVAADPKQEEKFRLSKEEQAILDLTNEARKKEDLPPLKPNPLLFKAARGHSANMAKKGELNHTLDGKAFNKRIEEAGYEPGWAGENIAYTIGLDPKTAFKIWTESAPHKENILRDQYEEIGIGIARGENGKVYYTQVFASPAKK